MSGLDITVDLSRTPWLDLDDLDPDQLVVGKLTRLGMQPNLGEDGPSVQMITVLPDGRYVLGQVSLRLFYSAAQVFAATPWALAHDLSAPWSDDDDES